MLEANGLRKGDFQLLSMGSGNERIHAIRGGRVQGTLLSPPDDFSILDEGFRSMGFVGDYLKDVQFNGYSVTIIALGRARMATRWSFFCVRSSGPFRGYTTPSIEKRQ
jgi:hypothetical protein